MTRRAILHQSKPHGFMFDGQEDGFNGKEDRMKGGQRLQAEIEAILRGA